MAEKEKLISSVKNLGDSTMTTSSNIVGDSKANIPSLERGSRMQEAIKGFTGSDDFVSAKQAGSPQLNISRSSDGAVSIEQIGADPQDVLAGPNIEETLTDPQAPVSDALGIFEAQEQAAGVTDAQTEYDTAQKAYLDAVNLANQQQLTIEGRKKKLGVLRGEQATASAQAQQELQTLQTGMTLAGSKLEAAQAKAAQRAGILYDEYKQKTDLQLQYPGLDIDPINDSFADVSQKMDEYQEEKKKEIEKDAYKEALRAIGESTKGSRKELEERLAKANKKAYEQAQKQSEIQLESMETSLAQAKKKMNEANKPPVNPNDPKAWGDEGGGDDQEDPFEEW